MDAVTRVFNGNYTIPVHFTFYDLADQIDTQFFSGNSPVPPTEYLQPLLSAYDNQKQTWLRKAIFPSFFHGKCQDPVTGVNPPGCPNPDCPVVCGTPGSMVHYYSRLRYIAFNATWHLLHELTRTDSAVFEQVRRNVEGALEVVATGAAGGRVRRGERRRRGPARLEALNSLVGLNDVPALDSIHSNGLGLVKPQKGGEMALLNGLNLRDELPDNLPKSTITLVSGLPRRLFVDRGLEKRDQHTRDTLARIFRRIRFSLEQICGGTGKGKTNGLPYCSWEQQMKEYILTFP
ncbi:hypothetical protein CC1G_07485 [Coprinopsis cinerea okayama7|uniref:Uncharacterized protein n=1 Tax=Coprinopsis cinerea (strain Okayama-7 / 130 / ATCC MYA-4618 / FGSC 9003) TaxID=240176 RepID=A8NBB5_COPC7|nr:hypothetical protein CC1G_07485 [Coprinopsis cinerea okayama7\|eukprot:XP_001832114.2 hypothetical protein CC1G_07485 [Coprinopsis cinerea okayama7\